MKLKIGTKVGIGVNNNINYCEILNISKDGVSFYVINGGYSALLRLNGDIVFAADSDDILTHKASIMFVFYPGEDEGMDYNEGCEYIKKNLESGLARFVSWKIRQAGLVIYRLRKWISYKLDPDSERKELERQEWLKDSVPF